MQVTRTVEKKKFKKNGNQMSRNNASCLMVSLVVDADVHAVRDLRVLLVFGVAGLRAGTNGRLVVNGRDDLAIGVHSDSMRGNLEVGHVGTAIGDSLLGLVNSLDLAAFATDGLQMLEVTGRNRGNVATAEDTDLKVCGLLLTILTGNRSTGILQIR